jgi:hypothetical protein
MWLRTTSWRALWASCGLRATAPRSSYAPLPWSLTGPRCPLFGTLFFISRLPFSLFVDPRYLLFPSPSPFSPFPSSVFFMAPRTFSNIDITSQCFLLPSSPSAGVSSLGAALARGGAAQGRRGLPARGRGSLRLLARVCASMALSQGQRWRRRSWWWRWWQRRS